MAATVNSFPLLHKYVLSPHDDMELTLTKLKFRLCVKEVTDVLQIRARGSLQTPTPNSDEESVISPAFSKVDDSGIDNDFSMLDDSHQQDMIPEEYEYERQHSSIGDEAFVQETLSSSSSSSSSDYGDASETEEVSKALSTEMTTGHTFGEGAGEEDELEVIHNVYAEHAQSAVPPAHALLSTDPVMVDLIIVEEEEEMEEREEEQEKKQEEAKEKEEVEIAVEKKQSEPLLYANETSGTEEIQDVKDRASAPVSQDSHVTSAEQTSDEPSTTHGDEKTNIDVFEALRILKAHTELPKINTRKAVVTFSCWNVADLVRAPQTIQTPETTELPRFKFQKTLLQVTNERILTKEKKIAEIYQKIKERDEADQKQMEEFMKKQKPTVTEALPLIAPAPSPNGVEKPKPALQPILKRENPVIVVTTPDIPASRSASMKRSTLTDEPQLKNKKKRQGSVIQNVVHSLQRRFSKRGRDSTPS